MCSHLVEWSRLRDSDGGSAPVDDIDTEVVLYGILTATAVRKRVWHGGINLGSHLVGRSRPRYSDSGFTPIDDYDSGDGTVFQIADLPYRKDLGSWLSLRFLGRFKCSPEHLSAYTKAAMDVLFVMRLRNRALYEELSWSSRRRSPNRGYLQSVRHEKKLEPNGELNRTKNAWKRRLQELWSMGLYAWIDGREGKSF